MKNKIIILYLLLVIILLIGCTNQQNTETTDTELEEVVTESETIETATPQQKLTEYYFTGTGKDVTKKFYLTEGLHIFNMKHELSESNFIVKLIDENGNYLY